MDVRPIQLVYPTLFLGLWLGIPAIGAAHWTQPFQAALPRGTLDITPDRPLTRDRFATLVQAAVGFPMRHRPWPGFADALPAENLRFAYANHFLSGHADGSLRPQEVMSRAHLFAAIAAGFEVPVPPVPDTLAYLRRYFGDEVPGFAQWAIAALTHHQILVLYPDPRLLKAHQPATEGEAIALLQRALAFRDRRPQLASAYVPTADQPRVTRLQVSLSQRRVAAFVGDRLLKSYPIAVGKAGWETPTGTFTVRQLFTDPDWQNPFTGEVIAAGDPENPLGDRWIGFWTDGQNWSGFHGTPNRHSVGTAASHGCLRMFNEDIRELFGWVSTRTVVEVRR
ncbi:MAG: L,D-transpeptidase [Pseudanabaenaceae cyanobacterium]